MSPEPTQLMLRASALIHLSPAMLFVGVYSTETYEPLALADREKVQINPEADENKCHTFSVTISRQQVQAIINHIRTPDNALTQINIAKLHFVCLRTGSNCMTGMSNFNMDYQAVSTKDVNETLFTLSNRHYGSQELLDGAHALQISAILKEEIIIIGLCKAGNCSSLKLIKEVLAQTEEQPVEKIILPSAGSRRSQFTARSDTFRQSLKTYSLIETQSMASDTNFALDEDNCVLNEYHSEKENGIPLSPKGESDSLLMGYKRQDSDISGGAEIVNRRLSTRTPEERKRDQMKRETEFCEDWRTATVRSIEALRQIGPFSQGNVTDDDTSPLVDNIDIGRSESPDAKQDSDDSDVAGWKSASMKKRPSRSTYV